MTATLEGSLVSKVLKGVNESTSDTLRCFIYKGEKRDLREAHGAPGSEGVDTAAAAGQREAGQRHREAEG